MRNPTESLPPANAPPGLPNEGRRWRLLGDVVLLQGKLVLDWLRDLLLSPVSLALALFGLLTSKDDPGRYFYRLMEWGRWSDRAINLFGAGEKMPGGGATQEPDGAGVDRLAAEIEAALIAQYQRSDFARKARSGIDSGLDRLAEQSAASGGRLRNVLGRAALRLTRKRATAGRPDPSGENSQS